MCIICSFFTEKWLIFLFIKLTEPESSNWNAITVRSDPNLKRAPDVTGQSQN